MCVWSMQLRWQLQSMAMQVVLRPCYSTAPSLQQRQIGKA